MSLPVYMYEENYQGPPWDKKLAAQPHSRRISSFDSFMERPKMHSRTPSIDSSISSLSSSRNKLQKKTKHHSTPSSWSSSRSPWSPASPPTNKPLPSLPIWHTHYEIKSEEEYQRRVAQAKEARAEMARRDAQMYEQGIDPEKLTRRPSMPDFGDSFLMERPRRRGTYSGKKGFRFYCEAITNFRNRNKN